MNENKRGFLSRFLGQKTSPQQAPQAMRRGTEPFLGEIAPFAGNFAPRGWALCNGQTLAISGNAALFSLLGTTYGGNGTTTFALPDLRGRIPIGEGSGYTLGDRYGVENHTLTLAEMPAHTHTTPVKVVIPRDNSGTQAQGAVNAPGQTVANGQVAGSGASHANMGPSLGITFIIATQGIFPSRL
jgi:microcystin-dependent protein